MKPELIAGKRATEEMIKGVGGFEAAAGFCRVQKSTLHEAASLNHPERFVPVDVVADLEPLAREREGWPHVTQWLCARMDGVFIPLPEAGPCEADVLRGFAALSREYGASSNTILDAAADGKVSATEAAKGAEDLFRVIVAAVGVHRLLLAIAEAG